MDAVHPSTACPTSPRRQPFPPPVAGHEGPFSAAVLVSCHRSSLAKSTDAGEDLIRGLDPDEGCGVLVVSSDVELNRSLKLTRAAVSAAADLLLGEHPKPALDLVDPGTVGGRVMDLEAGMAEQPAPDQLGLVGPVVVEDETNVKLAGHFLF